LQEGKDARVQEGKDARVQEGKDARVQEGDGAGASRPRAASWRAVGSARGAGAAKESRVCAAGPFSTTTPAGPVGLKAIWYPPGRGAR